MSNINRNDTHFYKAVINPAGRVVIPAPLRAKMGIQGATVVMMNATASPTGVGIEISRPEDLVARAQSVIRRRRRKAARRGK